MSSAEPLNKIPASKERQENLDVVCGIMISWMILGHILANCGLKDSMFYFIGNRLFPFFMPWFFFKSGVFYKQQKSVQVFKMAAHKLLIPWLVFSVLSVLILVWPRVFEVGLWDSIKEVVKSVLLLGTPSLNVSLWFLITLFFVKVIVNKFVSLGFTPLILFVGFLLLALIISFIKGHVNNPDLLRYPEYLYNSITGCCFYCAGILMREKKIKVPVFMICSFIHLVIIIGLFSFVDMEHNLLIDGYYIFWLFSCFTGIIVINYLFGYLCKKISFSALKYIGRHSMSFYITHFIIIRCVILYIAPALGFTDSWELFWIVIAICVLLLPLFSVVFDRDSFCWMIGKTSFKSA